MFRFRIAWVGEENCLSAVRKLFRGVWECGGQDSFESVSRGDESIEADRRIWVWRNILDEVPV